MARPGGPAVTAGASGRASTRMGPVVPPPRAPAAAALGRAQLLADLRDRVFAPRPGPDRVGAEVELIPVYADDGSPVQVWGSGSASAGGSRDAAAHLDVPGAAGVAGEPVGRPSLLGFLGAYGRPRGWRPLAPYPGVPGVSLPEGGALTLEPGGQLEYSSPAFGSVDAVVERLEAVIPPLVRAARDAGIAFVARGLDPVNPLSRARLELDAERYTRMAAHYDRRGPWGRRMMRQTAAVHVNLDLGDAPAERWAVANAAVPVWTAIFANSPRAEGRETGHRSVRAAQWRRLDPTRTGVLPARFARSGPARDTAEAAERYLEFALAADAFLLGPADLPAESLEHWLQGGVVDFGAWTDHLSTLFPEVRPRGYLELRPFDALHPRWYAAPLVLTVGLLYDPVARRAAAALLPPPTHAALERAGRRGLGNPALARLARDTAALALEGAERAGPLVGGRSLEVARAFVAELTYRGRDPGHEPGDRA